MQENNFFEQRKVKQSETAKVFHSEIFNIKNLRRKVYFFKDKVKVLRRISYQLWLQKVIIRNFKFEVSRKFQV